MVICKGKKATVVKYTQSAAKSSINNIIALQMVFAAHIAAAAVIIITKETVRVVMIT